MRADSWNRYTSSTFRRIDSYRPEILMCMLSLQLTQTVGSFRCTRKPEMLRLRSQNFACEVMNFACETILFRHAPSQAIEIVGARNLRFRGFVRFQGFTTHFISPYFSPFVFRSHALGA